MTENNRGVLERYKVTELGILPEDWSTVRLGDVTERRNETCQPSKDGGRKYIGLEHIDSGDSKLKRYGFENEVLSSKSQFFVDDILYGKLRPYLDKCAIANFDGICSTDIIVIKPRDVTIGSYVGNLLHLKTFVEYATKTMTGVNHPRTSWQSISKYTFPLPPLPEQKAIAHILQSVQEAKENTEEVIRATKELKKSMMKHLFTYGPVPPGEAENVKLKETEIGMIPEEWEVVTIENVAVKEKGSIKMGPFGSQLKKTELAKEGFKVYGQENLIKKDFALGNRFITDDKFESLKTFQLIADDVLVSMMGTIGHSSVLPNNVKVGIMDSHLIRIRVDQERIDPYFLSYLFYTESIRSEINNQSHGAIMKGLNTTIIKKLKIPLPALNVQKRILEIIYSLDSKIETEESKKISLEELFRTLLNDLMTARIRVKNLEA